MARRSSGRGALCAALTPGAAALAAAALGAVAQAGFLGATAEPFVGEGWREHGFEGLTAWRITANFDGRSGDQGLLSVFALPGAPWAMRSTDGRFRNAEHDSLCPPEDLRHEGIWENQWDTYVTINGACPVGPEFGKLTDGLRGDYECQCGMFVSPGDDRARAIDGRVFLGQFVLAEGASLSGTMNLLLLDGRQEERIEIEIVPCPADLDRSGAMDVADLVAILEAWGPCPEGSWCPEDLDRSRDVGVADLLVVLATWGPCA